MTIARRKQIHLDVTPFYHCITRCVRRAFLCGKDKETGRQYGHRRQWIEKHLILLSEVFCIDVAGYSVMSNHYHLVLRVNQRDAQSLTDKQVLARWLRLYKGPELMQRYANGEELTETELETVAATIGCWRVLGGFFDWILSALRPSNKNRLAGLHRGYMGILA